MNFVKEIGAFLRFFNAVVNENIPAGLNKNCCIPKNQLFIKEWALPTLHGGSLKITLTVSICAKKKFQKT